jgi:hypothetical protein
MHTTFSSSPAEFVMVLSFFYWAITIVVNVCFAVAVMWDANALPGARKPIFVGPGIWFLGTLLGGIFVAAAYWVMHHSRLNDAVPMGRTDAP